MEFLHHNMKPEDDDHCGSLRRSPGAIRGGDVDRRRHPQLRSTIIIIATRIESQLDMGNVIWAMYGVLAVQFLLPPCRGKKKKSPRENTRPAIDSHRCRRVSPLFSGLNNHLHTPGHKQTEWIKIRMM